MHLLNYISDREKEIESMDVSTVLIMISPDIDGQTFGQGSTVTLTVKVTNAIGYYYSSSNSMFVTQITSSTFTKTETLTMSELGEQTFSVCVSRGSSYINIKTVSFTVAGHFRTPEGSDYRSLEELFNTFNYLYPCCSTIDLNAYLVDKNHRDEAVDTKKIFEYVPYAKEDTWNIEMTADLRDYGYNLPLKVDTNLNEISAIKPGSKPQFNILRNSDFSPADVENVTLDGRINIDDDGSTNTITSYAGAFLFKNADSKFTIRTIQYKFVVQGGSIQSTSVITADYHSFTFNDGCACPTSICVLLSAGGGNGGGQHGINYSGDGGGSGASYGAIIDFSKSLSTQVGAGVIRSSGYFIELSLDSSGSVSFFGGRCSRIRYINAVNT